MGGGSEWRADACMHACRAGRSEARARATVPSSHTHLHLVRLLPLLLRLLPLALLLGLALEPLLSSGWRAEAGRAAEEGQRLRQAGGGSGGGGRDWAPGAMTSAAAPAAASGPVVSRGAVPGPLLEASPSSGGCTWRLHMPGTPSEPRAARGQASPAPACCWACPSRVRPPPRPCPCLPWLPALLLQLPAAARGAQCWGRGVQGAGAYDACALVPHTLC